MTTEQRMKALEALAYFKTQSFDTANGRDYQTLQLIEFVGKALSEPTPNPCCGSVGKEACMRYDQIAEDCDCNKIKGDAVEAKLRAIGERAHKIGRGESVEPKFRATDKGDAVQPAIDDELREAIDGVKVSIARRTIIYTGNDRERERLETLITYAIKGQSK